MRPCNTEVQRQAAAKQAKKMGLANRRHGKTRSREYERWHAMKQRCYDPKNPAYANYGGRGIRVCDRWRNSFEAFFEDMGPKPASNSQIDRIDPNGDYEPANCRWVSPKQQQRNRRQHVMLTYQGETLCLAEWAERFGKKTMLVWQRIVKLGWSVEKALTLPSTPRAGGMRLKITALARG